MSTRLAIPADARHVNKLTIRGKLLRGIYDKAETDTEAFASRLESPDVQAILGSYVAKLAERKSTKE